jgi:hypothetical protein
MMFNDVSTRTGLIQECEFWTGLGDAAISGETAMMQVFTRLINARYQQVVTMVLKSQDEWDYDDINHTTYPIVTTSLVASQQDYTLPASLKCLKIKRLELKMDGSNWRKAEPIDIEELAGASDSVTLSGLFTSSYPRYDIMGNALFLYPVPTAAVTGGIKLWISREIDEFTTSDTTQEPGLDEPFHRMIALGASLDWAIAKRLDAKADIEAVYTDYEARLLPYYGKKQEDRLQIVFKPEFQDIR